MNNKNLIYALQDPETKQIRYIGKSTKGLKRPHEHKRAYSLKAHTHKNNWIKSLFAKNLMYEIVVLEENIEDNQLDTKEIYWIAYHKSINSPLTNGTDGGEGSLGREISEETRKLLGEKKKGWFENKGPTQSQLDTCFKRKENIIKDGIEQRDCTDCKELKSLSEFPKNKNRYDGIGTICKLCNRNRMRERRLKNPPKKLSAEEFQQSYENRQNAMSEGLKERYKNDPEYRLKNSRAKSKPILQCDLNGRVIKEFSSALEAKKAGFQNSNVGQAIKYKKTYRGFTWKFKIKE